MALRVIRATSEHISDVAFLFNEYRIFYNQESDLHAATDFMIQRLERQDSVIFLAINQAQAVGFTQLYPSFSSVAMQRIWILNDLYVKNSARKLGVATGLMKQAKMFASETQAARLVLATGVDNQPAQALYEKLGWVKENAFLHFQFSL